jgi:uncharacterized protein YciI
LSRCRTLPQKDAARNGRLTAFASTSVPAVCRPPFTPRRGSGKLAVMFVIELTYKVDLAEIDAHMAAHVVFLKRYYDSGNFLVSGRKIPRDGGIILAVGKTRRQVEQIVEEDPFYEHGLADFRIIEFRASQRANDIQKRIDRF